MISLAPDEIRKVGGGAITALIFGEPVYGYFDGRRVLWHDIDVDQRKPPIHAFLDPCLRHEVIGAQRNAMIVFPLIVFVNDERNLTPASCPVLDDGDVAPG